MTTFFSILSYFALSWSSGYRAMLGLLLVAVAFGLALAGCFRRCTAEVEAALDALVPSLIWILFGCELTWSWIEALGFPKHGMPPARPGAELCLETLAPAAPPPADSWLPL